MHAPDGGYELDGDMTISDFLELLGWNEDALDDADSATVGGWTLERFGTFPKPGDSFRYEKSHRHSPGHGRPPRRACSCSPIRLPTRTNKCI